MIVIKTYLKKINLLPLSAASHTFVTPPTDKSPKVMTAMIATTINRNCLLFKKGDIQYISELNFLYLITKVSVHTTAFKPPTVV